jgi:hypothetical protein
MATSECIEKMLSRICEINCILFTWLIAAITFGAKNVDIFFPHFSIHLLRHMHVCTYVRLRTAKDVSCSSCDMAGYGRNNYKTWQWGLFALCYNFFLLPKISGSYIESLRMQDGQLWHFATVPGAEHYNIKLQCQHPVGSVIPTYAFSSQPRVSASLGHSSRHFKTY